MKALPFGGALVFAGGFFAVIIKRYNGVKTQKRQLRKSKCR